jgi:hypothetical protein
MAWTYNSVRIFTQKITPSIRQIIAKLQPLAGGTVYQTFGYETPNYKVSAYLVGETDRAAIEALAKTGATYALVAPEGAIGNFYLDGVSFDRQMVVCQTIRTDLATTSPVYIVDLELSKDA